ncbi:MAG TPA: YceI family protein [Longimicrobiales bacterium]|nr:YceI family protein [Longimicrobiales bacterium]
MTRAVMVMTVLALALPLTAARPMAGQSDPERYNIDASHSYVGFSVRHLAVTNVRGKFTRFSGHIMLNEQDMTKSTVNVTIEAGSIDTSNERRDADLRSDNFFDAGTFPSITFVGRRVERGDDGLVLVGDLTMRDVTKEVRVPFELTGPVVSANGQKRIGAEGTLRVNRFDYGLKWNTLREAVPVVGEEVRIELNVEAVTPRQQ